MSESTSPPGAMLGSVCCPGTAGGKTPTSVPPTDGTPAGNNDERQTLQWNMALRQRRYKVSRKDGGREEEK